MRDCENYNNQLFERLELRKKALKNWSKMRMLLVLLRVTNSNQVREEHPEPHQKNQSCKELMAYFVMTPTSVFNMIGDTIIGITYLLALYIDPLIWSSNFVML